MGKVEGRIRAVDPLVLHVANGCHAGMPLLYLQPNTTQHRRPSQSHWAKSDVWVLFIELQHREWLPDKADNLKHLQNLPLTRVLPAMSLLQPLP